MPPQDLSFAHRFVPGTDPLAPALLLLHGTGGNEDDLLPLGPMLWPGAAMLSPRGQVLERGMPRFFRRLAEGVFDLEDLRRRTDDLAAFVWAASERYGLSRDRLVAVGYSNGANIAASLLLLRPEALTRAVLWRAQVPIEPEVTPDLSGRDVFITAGVRDPLIPRAGTERLQAVLQAAGASVQVSWLDAGHELTRTDIDQARAWLADRLGSPSGENRSE